MPVGARGPAGGIPVGYVGDLVGCGTDAAVAFSRGQSARREIEHAMAGAARAVEPPPAGPVAPDRMPETLHVPCADRGHVLCSRPDRLSCTTSLDTVKPDECCIGCSSFWGRKSEPLSM
ncbi:hypothetical protein ZWY2020_034683 [Hordeum vulgare]|nr:hypothetical protein ZWY2020_034683 [Hordeum vulgare]